MKRELKKQKLCLWLANLWLNRGLELIPTSAFELEEIVILSFPDVCSTVLSEFLSPVRHRESTHSYLQTFIVDSSAFFGSRPAYNLELQ